MAIADLQNSIVQVSDDDVSYATIADLESWSGDHGEENASKRRVFGRADPYERAGDDTDEYRLAGLYNIADTNGQNVLREGKDTRTPIWIRVLPEGATTGAKGYKQRCRVTRYTDSGEADGDYVECEFTLTGIAGTRTAYTAP